MIVERTYDEDYIYRCITNPKVWQSGINDLNLIEPEFFFPPMGDEYVYLRLGDYGLFVGIKKDTQCDVHFSLLPKAIKKAYSLSEIAMNWAFDNLDCKTLVASIPEYNRLALKIANKLMNPAGINKQSFLKDGILFDQHLYVKERLCHQ